MSLSTVSLRGKLLLGFTAVALLTGALGVLANWQFSRVADASRRGSEDTLSTLTKRERIEQLGATRAQLLQRVQGVSTSSAVAELRAAPSWASLLQNHELAPDLAAAIDRYASARQEYLAQGETLTGRLNQIRTLESDLRVKLLPAERALAANQAKRTDAVNTEVETLRGDTISNLFVNFDATMEVISLAIDVQARLFHLQSAEAAGQPDAQLRGEIAAKLASNTDPAAQKLVQLLRVSVPPGSDLAATHPPLFKALDEFIANLIFTGRTTVVSKATESITLMGERSDEAQAGIRKLDEQRAALETGLQKISIRTAETLQSASAVLNEPNSGRLAPLVDSRQPNLAQGAEDKKQVTTVTSNLGLPWVTESLSQLQQNLYGESNSLISIAAGLVHARDDLNNAETNLHQALDADAERNQKATEAFLIEDRARAASIARITSTARQWTAGIAIAVAVLAVSFALVFARTLTRPLDLIIRTLSDASSEVARSATQVSQASLRLADGASRQAASLEQTSATLEEISSMSRRNAEGSSQANSLTREAREATHGAVGRTDELSSAMTAIRASSTDVAKIVKTIDEIAFQTNLLALNAAVEAARAGESGAGFAVVAGEVRSLAQRAAQAARESSGKIEESTRRSENGNVLSTHVAESLHVIEAKTERMTTMIGEISTATQEQSKGLEQVAQAVTQIDHVVQHNAATAQEAAAAATDLNKQTERLHDTIEQLRTMIEGKRSETPAIVSSPTPTPAAPPEKHSPKPARHASLA